jgi:hypothetical protein
MISACCASGDAGSDGTPDAELDGTPDAKPDSEPDSKMDSKLDSSLDWGDSLVFLDVTLGSWRLATGFDRLVSGYKQNPIIQ